MTIEQVLAQVEVLLELSRMLQQKIGVMNNYEPCRNALHSAQNLSKDLSILRNDLSAYVINKRSN